MKIIVPLFGKIVAPRFCYANEYLLAEAEDQKITKTQTIAIGAQTWHKTLITLKEIEVTVLLCSGFNQKHYPLAQELGIKVLSGLSGDAIALVEEYIAG